MRIDEVQPGKPVHGQNIPGRSGPAGKATPSFKDTLATFLKDVNHAQKTSGEAKMKLISGETTDVHQVMNKSAEADVAFNMLMELRNKALDGYNEIMRMRL